MISSFDREQFLIRRLWELHKSPRDHIDTLLGTGRDYSYFDKMLSEGTLRQDFRFRGFPNQSMQSPRQPITAPISEDKKRNEENFVKVFGKSSIFDPERRPVEAYRGSDASPRGNWTLAQAKPRSDGGYGGLQYGTDQIDNSPRARGMKDPFHDRSVAEMSKLRNLQEEANLDIKKFRQEKMMQDFHREEEKKRGDNRRRKFMETDSPREPVTYAREPQKPPTYSKPHRGHDLFLDTLGGPGGTVVRHDGGPGLQAMPDPRLGAYPRSPAKGSTEAELMAQDRHIRDQKQKIESLKKELDFLKSPRGSDAMRGNQGYQPPTNGYEPSFGARDAPLRPAPRVDFDEPRKEEKRSLDLDNTRGGAGAPRRDDRGKPITRFPVTMERDDYGSSKIQEKIPGKAYNIPDEPLYDPFGKPGGGAPMIDRYGNRNTHTFGNFETNVGGAFIRDSAEQTKRVRGKEVMLNELRVGMEEQQRNKAERTRYEKAPQGELAEVIRSKEVGKPKRDPITGHLANQHLPNSDVSKLKMNYQPVDDHEKRHLHSFLREQVEENEKKKYLERLRNQQESNKHFDQFDQRWGHFGGGAPKDRHVRKKVNLDNALYHYDRQSRSEESPRQQAHYNETLSGPRLVNPSYQKRFFEEDIRHRSPDVTPRYVKNTTKSTSSNQYEFPADKSPTISSRAAAPPYATVGSAHAAY